MTEGAAEFEGEEFKSVKLDAVAAFDRHCTQHEVWRHQ
jgi:hypothetical protein